MDGRLPFVSVSPESVAAGWLSWKCRDSVAPGTPMNVCSGPFAPSTVTALRTSTCEVTRYTPFVSRTTTVGGMPVTAVITVASSAAWMFVAALPHVSYG